MSRSIEIRRVEAALKGRSISELAWAIGFCERMLTRKQGNAALGKSNFALWNKKRLEAVRRHDELSHGAA
jgi:hypothetical protein